MGKVDGASARTYTFSSPVSRLNLKYGYIIISTYYTRKDVSKNGRRYVSMNNQATDSLNEMFAGAKGRDASISYLLSTSKWRNFEINIIKRQEL